jgi:undecaprenyl pyrophosphate phosphatase UppP
MSLLTSLFEFSKPDRIIKSIIFIGIFQILALIPGVSRAGITITAARFLNYNRVDSTKISFLLSIPALIGASSLGITDAFKETLEIIRHNHHTGFGKIN